MEEPVEVTLEIPQWLAREIEFYATPRGLSFSGVVVGLLTSEEFFREGSGLMPQGSFEPVTVKDIILLREIGDQ